MALWLQNLVVVALVAACAGVILRQAVATLWGRRGRLGSCCAKGCPPAATADGASEAKRGEAAGERVAFIPADLLCQSGRRRRRA